MSYSVKQFKFLNQNTILKSRNFKSFQTSMITEQSGDHNKLFWA